MATHWTSTKSIDTNRARVQIGPILDAASKSLAQNETSTRVEYIDQILLLMEWSTGETHREVKSGAGDFLDYELHRGSDPWMVVEAKRTGSTFDLAGFPSRSSSPLIGVESLLRRGGKSLREVLSQAASYCNSRAIPLACATNGYQWLFFRGLSTKSRPWTKGSAICFLSPQEVIDHVDDFAACFSKLDSDRTSTLSVLEWTTESRIPSYIIPRDRIPLARRQPEANSISMLRAVGEFLFGEIYGNDREEMLERCYIEPGNLGDFESSIRRLLKDTERPLIFGDEDVDTTSGDSVEFIAQIELRNKLMNQPAPVLVIGHVGAGKTTFLHRALARFGEDQSAFVALVDLEGHGHGNSFDATIEENRVSELILGRLGGAARAALKSRTGISNAKREEADPDSRKTLLQLMHSEIARARNLAPDLWKVDPTAWQRRELEILESAINAPLPLLERYIRHLRKRFSRANKSKYPILIVIDNLDQASDTYQRIIYGLAQRLARDTPAIVVVCLREDTYRSGRREGGFLTSSPLRLVYHVASPALDQLTSRRIKYGKYLEENGQLPPGLRDEADLFRDTCNLVTSTLLKPRSDSLGVVASLAGHNMRNALELIRAVVVGSALVSTRPNQTGEYSFECISAAMGLREFARLGLANIYDAEPFDPPMHSLRLRLLSYYSWAFEGSRGRAEREQTEGIVARFGALGYPIALVRSCILFLLEKNLIRAYAPQPDDTSVIYDLPARATITSSGFVHLAKLPLLPAYRAMAALSTRWYDHDLAQSFCRRAEDSGGTLGVSLSDIVAAQAVDVFDTYIDVSSAKEDSRLYFIPNSEWVRSIFGRTGRSGPNVNIEFPANAPRTEAGETMLSRQISLPFPDAELTSIRPSMPRLGRTVKYASSVWIPRILWALEFANRNSLGGLSAADIARILQSHADIDVNGTNVARAFRALSSSLVSHLWTSERKRYAVTEAGRNLLHTIASDDSL